MNEESYALLIIDMQLVAFDGKVTRPISNGLELLKRISTLIEICRAAGIPIIFLQTCAPSGQPYAKDVHGWEIHPDVAPQEEDRIVYKVQSNGFENTNLMEVLAQIGNNTIISCGIWSEFCVTATSKFALDSGFKVWLTADGHSTVADTDEEAVRIVARQNDYLKSENALVVDVETIKRQLAAS